MATCCNKNEFFWAQKSIFELTWGAWLESTWALWQINRSIKGLLYFVPSLLQISSTRSIFSQEQQPIWMFMCGKWSSSLLTCFGLCKPLSNKSLIGLLQRVIRFAPRPPLVFNYPCTLSFSSRRGWWRLHQTLISSFASACQAQMELFITVTARLILLWWWVS